MRIPNDIFDEDHNLRLKNDTEPAESDDEFEAESDDDFDNGGSGLLDRYPWLMKAGVVVGVLVAIGAVALGTRTVLGHHNSNEPNTAQTSERHRSKSSRHADNNAKKSSAIKRIAGSSSQSSANTSTVSSSSTDSSAASSTNNSSTASGQATGSAANTSANSTDASTTNGQDAEAQSVQKRIQSSLPTVKVGITTLSTKGDVDVSSVNDDGQVVTTLSSDGHKFATIVTNDGSDTLSLLPGYQAYADEHVSTK